MKKEIIVSGLVGVLIGIFLPPLLYGMWGWRSMHGWGPMMGMGCWGSSNNTTISMMGDIDRHFIEQMIPHHNDAILMAEIALMKAEHPEVKQLAQNIKRAQSEENTMMREWYRVRYGADVPDFDFFTGRGEGTMMRGEMMGDAVDVTALESAKPFDRELIRQMIPHHQMGVMMATMLFRGTRHAEMRNLAQTIIDAQSKEIDQMRLWYRDWYE